LGAIAAFLGEGDDRLASVRAMLDAAPHRGSQTAFASVGGCALGAIWDAGIHDVAIGVSDGLAVVVAGSIDNEVDLAEQYPAVRPPTRVEEPDAELVALIAAMYRAHGLDFPAQLRGMFAGVITDGSTAYCFRDQLGHKPLFYRHDGRSFWAGSEPKQVVAGPGLAREPDLAVVEAVFYRSLDDESPAALRGVERLPKMTGLVVDRTQVQRRRYWFPERLLESARFADSELQDRFDTAMSTAVRRTLTGSDVIFLSGGIDSPAIAAYGAELHRQLYDRPLEAVTIEFPRYPSVDEGRYVKLLADYYGMPLHGYEQQANAIADFSRWTALADTPYRAAALAQYEEAYARVRELGFQNILSGEHAEFLMAISWFTLDHYLTHARFRSAWRELRAHRAKGRSWFDIARRVGRAGLPSWVIAASDRMRGRRSPLVPLWVDVAVATEDAPVPIRERWRKSQLGAFIGPGTSLEADEICQAVSGVTVRRPWTDVDLWEFFLSLRAEQKFPDLRSKPLVRNLLRNRVPDEILDRTDKTVFDEAGRDRIDYDVLGRFLMRPEYRMRGVDYGRLGRLIAERKLTMLDYQWARDLANVHAFLAQWSGESRSAPG
jgi:asparagine synthetase B (glutamine-hydrolysing)